MSATYSVSSHFARRRSQAGAAILMAILTLALVAALAATIASEMGAAVEQLSGRNDQAQARWLARGAIEWARNVLQFDRKRFGYLTYYGDKQDWSRTVPPLAVDEGKVGGHIDDLSGRFNVNTLVANGVADPQRQTIFIRLLENIGVPHVEALKLTDAVTDWMDSDHRALTNGAEREFYARDEKAILPPDAPLISIDELRTVRGMTPALFENLSRYIAAVPAAGVKLNINTTTPAVLSAFTGLPLAQATPLIPQPGSFYAAVAQFVARLPAGGTYNTNELDVDSLYFMVRGTAQWGDTTTSLQVLLWRNPASPRPDIINETIL